MKILPTSLIKQLDAYTIEHEPIASIDLMERVAGVLADAICTRYDIGRRFVFFAGPGNNGGDALAVARLMAERGYLVEVYLFNTNGKLSPDCEVNRERLSVMKMNVDFHEVTNSFVPPMLSEEMVVVDGLFGSGLNKPLEKGFAQVVKYINASSAQVIAIDIPSGLMGEDNSINQMKHIIRASLTLTLQLPKLSFLFAENEPYVGEWEMLDIGLSREGLAMIDTDYYLVEHEEIKALLKPRKHFSHKGNYGKAMLIAGQMGMAGASILAARACLRSGVGLLTIHVPLCNNLIVQTAVPEAMTEVDCHDTCFTECANINGCQAVAVGPGLGRADETEQALLRQIDETTVPMVIDADALNILGDNSDYLYRLPHGSILTPHPKELERLVGRSDNSYEQLQRARQLAGDTQCVVVLKGAYTAVVMPDEKVFFNVTGNPGMATGGSGDVLTGILLALLAQGYNAIDAARLGVYVHGLAGDMAAKRQGQIGMVAGDITACLPMAWQCLVDS